MTVKCQIPSEGPWTDLSIGRLLPLLSPRYLQRSKTAHSCSRRKRHYLMIIFLDASLNKLTLHAPSIPVMARLRYSFVAMALVALLIYLFPLGFYASSFNNDGLSEVSDPLLDIDETSTTILLVSALFPLSHSKHTHEEYRKWLSNFLSCISTSDIYFYTTPDLEPLVRSLHANVSTTTRLTVDTTYTSPLLVPPLLPYKENYTQMHEWDREKARHSPELYAVWNAKPWFLDSAVRNAAGEYDYAFWVDAGSFRHEHAYRRWPDPRRVEEVWDEAYRMSRKEGLRGKGDLMFIPAFELPGKAQLTWSKEQGPVDIDFSEGA